MTDSTPQPIGDLIQDRIAILDAVLGGEPHVTLSTSSKGALQISVQSDAGAFLARSVLPKSYTIEGLDRPVRVEKVPFLSLLRRRAVTSISLENDVLVIRSNRYRSTLAVSDGIPPEGIPSLEDPTFETVLNESLWKALKSCVQMVAVEKSHPGLPDLDVHVRAVGKNLLVVTYDAYQACYVMTKMEEAADLNLTLPLPRLQSLLVKFPGEFTIRGGDFALEVYSKQVHARLNIPLRNQSSPDPDAVVARLEGQEKVGNKISMLADAVAVFLDNIKVVTHADAVVTIEVAGKKALVSCSSSSATVDCTLKVEASADVTFKISAQSLRIILAKAKKSQTLQLLVNEGSLLAMTDSVCYLTLLSV